MIDKEGDGPEAGAEEAVVSVEDTPAVDPKIEAEAKEMGWKPKEAWKGDPEGWRPADEFVKRGKEILPIVAAELRKAKAEVAELKRSHSEEIAGVTKANRSVIKMMRDQIEARYEPLKDRAIEQGDNKTFRQVEKAQKDAVKAFDAEVQEKPPAKGADDGKAPVKDAAIVSAWMDDNPWFSEKKANGSPKHPVLWAAAHEAWDDILEKRPGASTEDVLEEVKEAVQKRFPEEFGKKPRNGAAMVEGANGRGPEGGSSGGGEGWAKVPAEARKTAMAYITEERVYDHLVGAKPGQPLTQTQIKAAQEIYAREYLS